MFAVLSMYLTDYAFWRVERCFFGEDYSLCSANSLEAALAAKLGIWRSVMSVLLGMLDLPTSEIGRTIILLSRGLGGV